MRVLSSCTAQAAWMVGGTCRPGCQAAAALRPFFLQATACPVGPDRGVPSELMTTHRQLRGTSMCVLRGARSKRT